MTNAVVAEPTCTGCINGYLHSGQCVSVCPVGFYGSATYQSIATVSTSVCSACDSSCETCSGSGTGKCLTCPKDYYLQRGSTTTSYGSCIAKTATAPSSYVLYVTGAAPTVAVQSISYST